MKRRYYESFIRSCADDSKIFWTYHVNMRLTERGIHSSSVKQALKKCEIIEGYPMDLRLKSFLVLGFEKIKQPLHIVVAIDEEEKISESLHHINRIEKNGLMILK